MKRTTQSLLAAVAALTAITGLAALTAPGAREGDAGAKAPVRMPVERSILLCPSAGTSEAAGTLYTSFTPTAPASPGDPPGGSGGPSGKLAS
ncbi:hypothetical protein GTW66_01255 [Streptomyces sp. SID5473]|uniref:hypothetical protein n=1 Tax=Streptomyces sp. SID5473 TaxID=2690299 RepID=UPI00025CE4ED|nr:hypothetical protein [Streptomyces sp. SID5473]EIF90065.1 hypothetical protein [Streptomyces tsukubensis NRRL18488]MYS62806.1 hypothetical protein [Streptomyces sp. SID5473]